MAEHLSHSYPEGPYTSEQKAEDMQENARTYHAFLKTTKWSIGIIALILIGMYVFLVA